MARKISIPSSMKNSGRSPIFVDQIFLGLVFGRIFCPFPDGVDQALSLVGFLDGQVEDAGVVDLK